MLTFGLRKNWSDFFSELLATKHRSCALTQSEKKLDLHSDFFLELLTTKNRSVCAGHNWRPTSYQCLQWLCFICKIKLNVLILIPPTLVPLFPNFYLICASMCPFGLDSCHSQLPVCKIMIIYLQRLMGMGRVRICRITPVCWILMTSQLFITLNYTSEITSWFFMCISM